jgi:hypothetical protein
MHTETTYLGARCEGMGGEEGKHESTTGDMGRTGGQNKGGR